MTPARLSRKKALRDYLSAHAPQRIGEREWSELLQALNPISESYLRDLLRETGIPFEQPWAGIRQADFLELEQSLLEMLAVYSSALAAGDRERARYCRRQVIAAKDRARFSARRERISAEKRSEKEEMARWMLTWLENPPVFPAWVEVRKRVLGIPA